MPELRHLTEPVCEITQWRPTGADLKRAGIARSLEHFLPRPKDSGRLIGRRRLSKRGPSELRRLLYNAALAASKTKLWKPWYDNYRHKALPGTAALVVIAREIARIAFFLYRQKTTFDPSQLAIGNLT